MQKNRLLLLFTLLIGCFATKAQVLAPVWMNDIGGTGSVTVTKVVTDSQDNVYVTGSFQGTIDMSPGATVAHQLTSNGNLDIFIAKYTVGGVLVWCESIGDASADYPVSLCLDDTGNIYVTGQFRSAHMDSNPSTVGVFSLQNIAGLDIFLIKLTNAGNWIWSSQISGPGDEIVESVKADHLGNVYICGSFNSATYFGLANGSAAAVKISPNSQTDGFIAKYSGAGPSNKNPIWVDHFGGTGSQNIAYALTVDINNDVLVTGRSNDIGVTADFVAKYDTYGSITWINRVVRNNNYANSIATDLLGNVYIVGNFASQIVFDNTTPSGTLVESNPASIDAFIAKYDTNGKYLWATAFGQSGTNTNVFDAIADSKSNIYVCGQYNGAPDFNSTGRKPVLLQSYNGYNAFAVKFNSTGKYVCYTNMGSNAGGLTTTAGNSIALTTNNNIVVAGSFSNTTDFDPGICINSLAAKNSTSDGFIVLYNVTPTPIITGLNMSQQKTAAVIDTVKRTIDIMVKSGTDVTKLSPIVTINLGILSPASGTTHDFSSPYTYQVSNGCTSYDYTVTVTVEQSVSNADAGNDQSACNTSKFTMQANTPQTGTGTWSVIAPSSYTAFNQSNINNPNAQIANVPADTKVMLCWTITAVGVQRTSADTVVIYNYSSPAITGVKELLINSPGNTVTLSPNISGPGSFTYLWQPGTGLSDSIIARPIASPTQTTTYKLTVTNSNGCSATYSVKVLVAYALNIPSAFTPNQDGINDTWIIKNIEGYPNSEVSIFDRDGQAIYYSKGYTTPWNGEYKGKKLPTGTYYYVIKLNDKNNQNLSGTVTLVY